MTEPIPIDPHIQIGVDAFGDAFVICHIVMPPGSALSADNTEQLALKLLAAASAARMRAALVRKQLLEGIPPADAVAFVNSMLDE